MSAIGAITAGNRVTFEYNAVDFKTRPEQRQYHCKVEEVDTEWRTPTKSTSFDFTPIQSGTYTFAVQAIDRDLMYSESARFTFTVVPPWYLNGWIMFPSSGSILVILILAVVNGIRYYRQQRESERLETEAQ